MKYANPYDPLGIKKQIFANLIGGHYRMRKNYHICRPFGTHDHLLFLTVGGAGYIKTDSDQGVTIESDSLGFYSPGIPHDYRTDPEVGYWNFFWVHFHPKESWRDLLQWPEPIHGFHQISIKQFSMPARRRIRALLEEIIRQAQFTSPLGDAIAMNLLENLFLHTFIDPSKEKKDNNFVETLRKYILDHLDQPITVESLSEFTSLSTSRLAHRFKKNFGVSPRTYVENARLEKAKRLLTSGECRTVKEAAYAVGFSDPLNFSRRFHHHYGFTPMSLIEKDLNK